MKLSLPVESVRERDIDFLLIEEFLSSGDFCAFFADANALPTFDKAVKVERSIIDFGLGETDVFVEYLSGKLRISLLIENKLDAIFQPQQAQRYYARAAHHQKTGAYDQAHVVLVAPQQYLDRQNDFALCVSYEQLIDYFKNSELGDRGAFKAQLLSIATDKLRRGYVAVNSSSNQSFWNKYRAQLSISVPAAAMKSVATVPAGSDWIDVSIGSYKFVHKLAKGYLDFTNLSAELTAQINSIFGDRIDYIEFKSGQTLRIHTTPLDRLSAFEDQLPQIEQCLYDIQTLVPIFNT